MSEVSEQEDAAPAPGVPVYTKLVKPGHKRNLSHDYEDIDMGTVIRKKPSMGEDMRGRVDTGESRGTECTEYFSMLSSPLTVRAQSRPRTRSIMDKIE